MNQYFDDTQITEEDLPSVRLITRDDFANEKFDAGEFLQSIHKFQTLDDLRSQLRSWDNVLAQELVDAVNEDYSSFIGLGKSLNSGEDSVKDVKLEVRRFQSSLKKIKQGLDDKVTETQLLLQQHKELAQIEAEASGLLTLMRGLNDLELLVESPNQSVADLERLAKLHVLVKRLIEDYNGHTQVVGLKSRVSHAEIKLMKLIETAWSSTNNAEARLDLLMIRQKVKGN